MFKLALTIRFSSGRDEELKAASTAEPHARFAIAVNYEPMYGRPVEEALRVFGAIAALGVKQSDENRLIATQAAK